MPTEIRTTFELPEWPYAISTFGPCPEQLTKFLQDLSVVRLEVEGKAHKLIIPVREDSPKYKLGEFPNKWPVWQGFTSSGDFNPTDLVIRKWNPKHPSFERMVGHVPDNAAWMEWNRSITVKAMDSSGVYFA